MVLENHLLRICCKYFFVSDKKKIAFGTESNKKDSRKIETLPYETSDAYVFINIETEKDYFISLGVNIPNKKSRPLRSFWVLNQAYGKDDNEELIDLAIHKDNIPFHKDFLIGNTIPPIDKLMIHLREEKGLFLRSFSDKTQKKELYNFLFEKGILPINLALDSSLDAFAKVIQSFSKAKTLDTDSDESLKRFFLMVRWTISNPNMKNTKKEPGKTYHRLQRLRHTHRYS